MTNITLTRLENLVAQLQDEVKTIRSNGFVDFLRCANRAELFDIITASFEIICASEQNRYKYQYNPRDRIGTLSRKQLKSQKEGGK